MGGIEGRVYKPLYAGQANTFQNQTVDPTPSPEKILAMAAGAVIGGGSKGAGGANPVGVAYGAYDGAKTAAQIFDFITPKKVITPEQHYGKNTASARQNMIMRGDRGSASSRRRR
ncbi:MAG: hypothetical protein RLZZ86_97 [Cyanobacteriota bacterium]|jgi:hypothetical protein